LTLVWVISVAVILAQVAGPVSAITMLPAVAATMASQKPQVRALLHQVLCKAACTSQDNLLDWRGRFR